MWAIAVTYARTCSLYRMRHWTPQVNNRWHTASHTAWYHVWHNHLCTANHILKHRVHNKDHHVWSCTRVHVCGPNSLTVLLSTRSYRANVIPYSINERSVRSWSRFLGSQPTGDLVINSAVSYHYFPQGPQLPSKPKSITPLAGTKNTTWWHRHTGVSSLPKAITRYCQARTRTRDLWIASPIPHQYQYWSQQCKMHRRRGWAAIGLQVLGWGGDTLAPTGFRH